MTLQEECHLTLDEYDYCIRWLFEIVKKYNMESDFMVFPMSLKQHFPVEVILFNDRYTISYSPGYQCPIIWTIHMPTPYSEKPQDCLLRSNQEALWSYGEIMGAVQDGYCLKTGYFINPCQVSTILAELMSNSRSNEAKGETMEERNSFLRHYISKWFLIYVDKVEKIPHELVTFLLKNV